MQYTSEIQKFVTSQSLYSALRISLSVVIPSIILSYFGLLQDFFLFPLATSFVGLADQPGPYIRRRNTLLIAVLCFIFVATTASLLKDFTPLIYLEILIFGIFFSMIGIYGQRMAAVGGLTLVVLSIFIDGRFIRFDLLAELLIFFAGSLWYVVVFLVVSKIQPYKLASQLIGENYIELSNYLKIKAKLYDPNEDPEMVLQEIISKQVDIKNLQEETREVVFKTRVFVNESTKKSRMLMLLFLNSIDLFEKIFTSNHDYEKLVKQFEKEDILSLIRNFMHVLAQEVEEIGIALQVGANKYSSQKIQEDLQALFDDYFTYRKLAISPEKLEDFIALRLVLSRLKELTNEVQTTGKIFSQDQQVKKKLAHGLDYNRFLPESEGLNIKVFPSNFSLKSLHFRHALRITLAMLLGYGVSKFPELGIGHSYWILITIIAIMRPAYSTTKHRNILRIYGTISGATLAYFLLIFVTNEVVLLSILFAAMILTFAFLKTKYAWSVFFMTIYIFITFNFLHPGNVNAVFKDRVVDTVIAGVLVFAISYFVLPVWEHTQTLDLMKKTAKDNIDYFKMVMQKFTEGPPKNEEYKLVRKSAMISLANLSDNFQRMLSDPKNKRDQLEKVHQFVNTSHLITTYIASVSQYGNSKMPLKEIDFENWNSKILTTLRTTSDLLEDIKYKEEVKILEEPNDLVDELLMKRKSEIEENEFIDRRDPNLVSHLTQIKNMQDLLELLYDVAKEQNKVVQNYLDPAPGI